MNAGAALCFDLSDFGDPAILNSFLLDNLRAHSVPLPLCSVMCAPPPGAHCQLLAQLYQLRQALLYSCIPCRAVQAHFCGKGPILTSPLNLTVPQIQPGKLGMIAAMC